VPVAAGRRVQGPRRSIRRPQLAREPAGPRRLGVRDDVVGTFFIGGVRAFDLSDPFRPTEAAYYVPAAPRGSRAGAVQINDVFVDERGIVYAVDRLTGGLYVLELTL
jgi:hypothetical protein